MNTKLYLLFLLPVILLTGCMSSPIGRSVVTTAAAAGGGAAGGKIGHGKPGVTAAVTAGTVAAVEGLHYYQTQAEKKAFNSGYDLGRSDAAKTQYWIQQRQQKEACSPDRLTVYPIPLPAQTLGGIRYEPSTHFLNIYE